MGYTPLFDSLTRGTLCGKWPDIGLWPIVLSMADRNGVIDATPAYIASVTGLAVDEVVACMARFCEPDPFSRSQEANGARLKLLDEHRQWGWLVVNHGKYREKARKQSYDSERTAMGQDAERKRLSREVPRSPDVSRALPLSDLDTDKDSNKEGEKSAREARPAKKASKRCPPDFQITPELREWAKKYPGVDLEAETEKLRDWEFRDARSDWPAAWRRWIRKAAEERAGKTNGAASDGPYI
jgi:hypothetical protein